ncbi:MAG: hypothetical protein GY861_01680, partial [bacterium]|nr:hypothetical protein [bacterium]
MKGKDSKIKNAIEKKRKELILPLYFGWEIAIRKITNLKKHIVGPFKEYWQYMTAVMILIMITSTAIFLNKDLLLNAATYTFVQTSWSGGVTANNANHASDRTGWDEYSAIDAGLVAGSSITLTTSQYQAIQTSDDGSADTPDESGFDAGTASNVDVVGTGASAYLDLDSSSYSGTFESATMDLSASSDIATTTWSETSAASSSLEIQLAYSNNSNGPWEYQTIRTRTADSFGSETPIYRSVGNTSSDLNTNSRTVTISGTTATFSGAMPDNVGVGDVLQYSESGYKVAFITGRASSTEYTVQSATGGTPTATTGTAVNVYRAHLE